MLTKAGYKVAASCGLKDWREKKKPLVGTGGAPGKEERK
jgi:hypothetical protein